MPDFNRTKRIIYIILGIAVLGAIGFFLYRLLVSPAAEPPADLPRISGRTIGGAPVALPPEERPAETPPLPELPSIAEERLVRLTDFPVVSPTLNKDQTRVLYYKKDGGDLYSSDFSGKTQEKISNLTIIGLLEAIWNPTGERAAVRYLDGNVVKSFLQIGTSSVAVLPQDITSVSWSPDGKSLAYLLPREGGADLVIADASGRSPRTAFRTPLVDADISWIASDLIVFGTAPSGLAEGYLFAFSRRDNSFSRMVGPAFGLTGLWSPDGTAALLSSADRGGKKLILSSYDRAKNAAGPIPIATLAEKCAWAGIDNAFCAVPREIPGKTLLPDEYVRGEFNSSDRIVAVDLKTGGISEFFSEGAFDMSDLVTAKDKKYLFFVNRVDGTLWSLKLQ
jgi:hypothetical protein